MKYIIMCGGKYDIWATPRQLTRIKGKTLIERTFLMLWDNGVRSTDIYISTNIEAIRKYCEDMKYQVLWHTDNNWVVPKPGVSTGDWCDCFYPMEEPACYLMGDVVFSPHAIRTIVNTPTEDIEFFASAPPFAHNYSKPYAEPFAFKVMDQNHLKQAQKQCKQLRKQKVFRRDPIAWEFWQVVKNTPINIIDYTNYTVINDYTCDIDEPKDIEKFEGAGV